jgi:pantothenate synthetase
MKKKKIVSINNKKNRLNIIKKILLFGVTKIDYLEYINLKTLKPPKKTNENYNIFIAYYMGKVRLIDNL